MRVRLKGLASSTKKLADGSKVIYWYAWRKGPRLPGKPGDPDFVAAYNRAVAQRPAVSAGKFVSILSAYRASPAFTSLAASTRQIYPIYLKRIEEKFGGCPIAALNDQRIRADFYAWRDSMKDTPRAADYAVSVLTKVLAFGKDRGLVRENHAERMERLYHSNRADVRWGEGDIARLYEVASPQVRAAAMLALWTAQRQGDLLELPWSAYDGKRIELRQSKSRRNGVAGRLLTIPVAGPLKELLDGLKTENAARAVPSVTILTNSRGKPWKTGFGASWAEAMTKAGLKADDLHFHDLRGTAITRLAIADCTVPQIASISGHSFAQVTRILERYLALDVQLAEAAIMKLEANEMQTKIANRLQTACADTKSMSAPQAAI